MDEVSLKDAPGLHCHSPRVGFSDRDVDGTKLGCGRGRVTTLGKSVYPERLQSSAKSVSREPVHWYSSAGEGAQGARACGRSPRLRPHAFPCSTTRGFGPHDGPPLRGRQPYNHFKM